MFIVGLGAYGFAQTAISSAPFPDLPLPPEQAKEMQAALKEAGLANLPAASSAVRPLAKPGTPVALDSGATPSLGATDGAAIPLPPLPGAPATTSAATPAVPEPSTAPAAATASGSPVAAAGATAPAGAVLNATPATAATATNANVPAVPIPGLPELTPAPAAADTTANASIPAPPSGLSLPVPPSMDNVATPGMPLMPTVTTAATPLPEVNVTPEKPKIKTWKTTLAPAIVPPETKFHYRRHILPGTIYQPQYAEYNQHLPKLITRQDYENLLFYSVTKNDIPTVRALLNAGTNINATDENGSTALEVARGTGNRAVAEMLMARGAR